MLYPYWTAKSSATYTVTYNSGAYGSGSQTTATKTDGVSLTLKGATFTRTGYTQTGWSTDYYGSTKDYTLSGSYTSNSGTTLYPYWTANTYSISYVLNSGSHGSKHPASATYGSAFYVSAPTRSGYTFAGWMVTSGLNTSTAKWGTSSSPSTSIGSSSTKCVNGTSSVYFKNLTATSGGSVTLTANWTEVQKPTYTVTYSAGYYGSGSQTPATKTEGVSLTLPGATFTRTGYTQTGWSTDYYGSTKDYTLSGSYTSNSGTTLYPYWTANTYSISYVLNGGSHGSTHPTSATYDSAFYVSAPSRSGYTFAGWTVTSGLNTSTAKWGTSSSPSTSISSSSTKCVNGTSSVYFKNLTATSGGSVTLTANWTEVQKPTYTVTYSAGYYGLGSQTTATKTKDVSLTLKDATFTRTGYTQTGWSTDYYGSTKDYTLSGSYTSNSGTTLYPYWTANTYSISYVLNGGSHGSTHPTSATYDSAFYVSAPSRSGYTFAGWTVTSGLNTSTAKWGTSSSPSTSISSSSTKCVNGTGSVYFKNLTATSGGSVTLTANWTVDPLADFEISGGVLTKYKGAGGAVTIPTGVTEIGNSAFRDCSELTSVTIPSSVTNIGWRAFLNCGGLTSVVIPEGVTSIGCYAFERCNKLKSVVIPGSMKEILDFAFYSCHDLASVTIRAGLIGYGAFEGCSGLKSVTISSGVTQIGERAFEDCSGLMSVSIPSSVTNVGALAFKRCSGLKSVTFLLGAARVGFAAFQDCESLTAVHISDIDAWCKIAFEIDDPATMSSHDKFSSNPLWYARHLYLNGEEVRDVCVPSSVANIGSIAFVGCSGLESAVISSSVTNIGQWAFLYCSGLTSVTIPEGVKSMGVAAFGDCTGLTTVTLPSSMTSVGEAAFYECSGLASVRIAEGVSSIGIEAFARCSSLRSVRIPSTLTAIDHRAFSQCNELAAVFVSTGDATRVALLYPFATGVKIIDLSATLVPGEKMEYGTELKGYTASGLPTGLTYNRTSGMITGAATKPGEYAVKFTKSGAEPEEMTIVVTEMPKLSVTLMGSGTGKVSGDGECLANAKVTLKATADTKDAVATVKSAFAGWFADADCTQPLDGTVDYRTASFPYVMPAEDVAVYAKFVAVAEDATRLSVANIAEGETFTVNDSWTKKIEVDSYSIPSVSAKGLPAGLKFDAKTLTISGKPTKPGKYDIELSLKNASVKTAKKFTFKIVVPNLESDLIADGIDYASDAYTYVAGTKIAPIQPMLADGVTVKATGLPSGLKLVGGKNGVPYSIEGTSTAKPGAYTVTLTLTKGKEKETATITVNIENRKLDLVMATCDGSLTNGCKVTGGGSYAAGKKVTLKATAATYKKATAKTPEQKATVFAGWYRNPDCTEALAGTVDYRTTSYSHVTTDQDETIYAKFVPAADDVTIGLAVNGDEVVDDSGVVRVVVKDAATLPTVEIGSVSIPKASVKGLPAGLKWDAKKNCFTGAPTKPGVYKVAFSLTNTTVKKAIVRAFTIEVPNFESPAFPGLKSASDAYPVSVGVAALPAVDAGLASAYADYTVKVTGLPSGLIWKSGVLTGLAKKAGDYTVTFTATRGKDKQVSTVTIHVEALPDWAVGTFVGMVRQVDRDESGEIIEDEDGPHDWYDILTTVSVTSAGKVSGKLHFESGTDVSFKSDSISERTDAGYVVRGQLKARGIASDFELLLRKIGIETTGVGDLGAVDVLMRQTARQEGANWIECDETTFSTEEDAPLRQNVWSSKKLPLPPSVNGVKKTVTVEDNIYTLTFGKNGSVKVSLAKADKPMKAIASGSATLSIVGHASEVWHCELCTSVVVKKNDYGAVCIFDVTILEDGTVTCVPQK